MDGEKLESIIESLGVVEVSHKGRPVWLEGIKGELVQVTYLDDNKLADVSANELVEKDEY